MTPEVASAIIAAGAAVITVGMAIWTRSMDKSSDNSTKLAILDERVKVLWLAWLRRGIGEGIDHEMFSVNSPIKLNAKSARMFADLIEPLRKFYRTLPKDLLDPEIQFHIEKTFGEQIVKVVCIPYHIHNAACLHAALELSRMSDDELYLLTKSTS